MTQQHLPPFMSYPQVRQRATLLHRTLNQSGMPDTLTHLLYPGAKGTRVYPRIYIEALLRHPEIPDRITPQMVRQFNASPDGRDAVAKSMAEWRWNIASLSSRPPVGLITPAQAGAVMGAGEGTVSFWCKEHPEITQVYEDRRYIIAASFEGLFEWRHPT